MSENPPMRESSMRYVVLRDRESGTCFWTTGGQFRLDLYELAFQSDDLDEVKDFYMKIRYQTPVRSSHFP